METNKLTFKKLADYLLFLPSAIGLIYIFGFIIINSHLAKFGFSSSSLLDKTYISAGGLFVLFASTIFLNLIYYIKKPTDVIGSAIFSELKYLIFVLLTAIAYTYLFVDIQKLSPNVTGSFWIALLIISAVTITFKPRVKLIIILVLFVIMFYFIWTIIYSPNARGLLTGYFVFAIFCLSVYGQVGDFGFAYVDIIWWFGAIVLSVYLFGSHIYGDIKRELGGGTSTGINLILSTNIDGFSNTVLTDSSKNGLSKDVNLIYETSDYFFISVDSIYIKIRRELFDGYVTNSNN